VRFGYLHKEVQVSGRSIEVDFRVGSEETTQAPSAAGSTSEAASS
jgi:hypothetical protein